MFMSGMYTGRKFMIRLPDDDTLNKLSEFYKVFGDYTRVKLLCLLRQGEMCVQDIADSLGMTQSAISHQLRVLKSISLVNGRREGKTVFYSLADDHISGILDMGLEHINE